MQQQEQGTSTTSVDSGFFYPSKLGSFSATTPSIPQLTTSLADQALFENYNLKWEEASLEQKMAALKLETQKQLLNELMLQKQLPHSACTYPAEFHIRTAKTPNQRNRELYKTALCDFWSAGVPCRFGDRCWFAHGPHELRIARFVYPGLHPYDYEIRMNSSNTLTPSYARQFWNFDQNCPVVNSQSTSLTLSAMGPNVPIGYERKLRRISPVHENVTVKDWRVAQRGISDGDSGIGSAGTNNSPEVKSLFRQQLHVEMALHFSVHNQVYFSCDELQPVPVFKLRPLDTVTSREQTSQKGEAFNRWLSAGNVQPKNLKVPPGLEQMGWWPDTISSTYPFINRPTSSTQPSQSTGATSEHCYSICFDPKLDKVDA
ncbi:unnamed protein product [Thelazia callipaeda]|uniref:C3H1-type domain-containing protein n=1 Tax=Thelazia callipaeda TaxID=103827 RepID=A0A0N5CLV6_THECL|nr:unnamed protein product [Thelazia callipaeda]